MKVSSTFWTDKIEDLFEDLNKKHCEGKFELLEIAEEFEVKDGQFRVKVYTEDEEMNACELFFVMDIPTRNAYFSNGYNRLGDLLEFSVIEKEVALTK